MFQLLPTIERMIELYRHPRDINRFKEYIQLINGETKGDMEFPIGNFNPMGKPHVLEKLETLRSLGAEGIIEQVAREISSRDLTTKPGGNFRIALNLADDLAGGWTNRFTTDYDSKFKLSAMINRGFCVPLFWTSESYNHNTIADRIAEYVYRSIYWMSNPKPKTLRDHITQERFVSGHVSMRKEAGQIDHFEQLNFLYQRFEESDDYQTIFNFLYGDNASISLGLKTYGAKGEMPGFAFAKATS